LDNPVREENFARCGQQNTGRRGVKLASTRKVYVGEKTKLNGLMLGEENFERGKHINTINIIIVYTVINTSTDTVINIVIIHTSTQSFTHQLTQSSTYSHIDTVFPHTIASTHKHINTSTHQ
jgi:hypothetical protein